MLLLGHPRSRRLTLILSWIPNPRGVFDAILKTEKRTESKHRACFTDDFLPPPPDWREKSLPIQLAGDVAYFHYDFRAQALAKIERGHKQDLSDVSELLRKSVVHKDELLVVFQQIKSGLVRYPAIDPISLSRSSGISFRRPGHDAFRNRRV